MRSERRCLVPEKDEQPGDLRVFGELMSGIDSRSRICLVSHPEDADHAARDHVQLPPCNEEEVLARDRVAVDLISSGIDEVDVPVGVVVVAPATTLRRAVGAG